MRFRLLNHEGPRELPRVGTASGRAVPSDRRGMAPVGPLLENMAGFGLPEPESGGLGEHQLGRWDLHSIDLEVEDVADGQVDLDAGLANDRVSRSREQVLDRAWQRLRLAAGDDDCEYGDERNEGDRQSANGKPVLLRIHGGIVRPRRRDPVVDRRYRRGVQVNPALSSLGAYPITAIQETARRMRDGGERLIDFSIGDPREPTPDFIKEAMIGAVPATSQYPTVRGLDTLREAVAAYVDRRFGVSVDPSTQVLPTSGAKEAIFSTPFAFIDPAAGQSVIYGVPGYPVYERGTVFAGAHRDPIVLDGDFVLRSSDVTAPQWQRAAMLWACTPHNPAGAITSRADLAELVDSCRAHGVLMLSDECYSDIYDAEPPTSVLEVAGPGASGVLSFISCSKRSGMTGYRTGAIIGDAEAIDALRRLRSSVGVGSPEFIQSAAAAAWSDDEHAAQRRQTFARKRAVLRTAFEATGHEVVASEAGLYLWVRVEDDFAMTERLLAEGVVVSPGSAFGEGGEGYLRLALVPTVVECGEAVEVLKRCLIDKS